MENENIIEKEIKGLKKLLKKIKKLKKKNKIILGIVLIIILIILAFIIFSKEKSPYTFVKVLRSDVIEQVSATGTVESAEEIDLRFKTSGIIESINVKIGDSVKKGTYLVRLSSGSEYSQYLQAQALYNQAKAKLNQLLAGTTSEEIQVAKQLAENARIALDDSKAKADNDLNEDYNNSLVYLVDASSKCNKALADLKDIERIYFFRGAQLDNIYKDKRSSAENSFKGYSSVKGAQEYVNDAIINPTHENISLALIEMKSCIQKFIIALDYAKLAMSDPTVREDAVASDKSIIDTDIINVNTAYSNINSSQLAISNQLIANQTSINSANSSYKKSLLDLEKLQAPPRNVDIAVFQADVDKYLANMSEFSQKLRDASIIAPFDGIVSKIDGKIGEVIGVNDKIIVSLISPRDFQIKVDIPETDIEKIDLDDSVEITLDAFPEEVLLGQIVEIELGETIIEGVVYYRIKILFQEQEKIKSGMTGNADIQTAKKENVLNVPYRAIVFKENKRFVKILDKKEIKELEVETGLKGINGNIEIVSGLEQGQEIISFIKK